MWSKKPTPVLRVPAPVPDRPSVSGTSVSPVLRVSWAVRVTVVDSDAAAIEAAWAGKPSASRDRHAGGGQRGRRVAQADLGHPAPEVADVEAGGEARGALGRQRVVRTRDVVAERGPGGVADEQAAGAADPRRERLGRRARELQVLGRERLGERQRGLHVVGEHLRRRPRAPSRIAWVVADRDGQRALAVLGLGVRGRARAPRRRRPSVAITVRSDGPGEAVDPDDVRDLPLGLLHPQAAGADDHVHARDRLRAVGERGDRLRAGDRRTRASTRTAAPRRGSSGAARVAT